MGGDNYFLSMMAGAVGGFKLQKTWVNSKEKQMLTERKIKRGIKISSLNEAKKNFQIWQETFCGNFYSKFLARGGVSLRGNLASYK